jgi:hypothetical protein
MTLSQLSRAQSLFADFKGSLCDQTLCQSALLIARHSVLRVCELRDREKEVYSFCARGNFLAVFSLKREEPNFFLFRRLFYVSELPFAATISSGT